MSPAPDTGLSAQQIQKIHTVLARHGAIASAILYGSRSMGRHKPGSDIDLVLVGDALSLGDLLKIENELDDLLLPYKIDLSLRHQIDNPQLLEHIRDFGSVFFVRVEKDPANAL